MSSRFVNALLVQSSHWPSTSQWVKTLVLQWGMEPQSLAIWTNAITARPPRHRFVFGILLLFFAHS